jgi:nucleotide-binding universal stress UspA family protein
MYTNHKIITVEGVMMKIKNILFPTDFTEGALSALPYAVDLAKSYNAKLYLLHVIYDMSASTGLHVPHASLDEMYEEMQKGAEKEIEKVGAEMRVELKNVETKVVRGVPYEEIRRFARENGMDLIIMGTHGRSGFDRIVFGSTAEKVVRNAVCPVLTIRTQKAK